MGTFSVDQMHWKCFVLGLIGLYMHTLHRVSKGPKAVVRTGYYHYTYRECNLIDNSQSCALIIIYRERMLLFSARYLYLSTYNYTHMPDRL